MSAKVSAKTSKNEEMLGKVQDLLQQNRLSDGEKLLKKIIKNDPKATTPLLYLAEVQTKTGRYEPALNSLAKIIKIDPNHQKAWRYIGFIETFARENPTRAIDALTKALELDHTDPEVYCYMGYLSQIMNQYDDSIELLEIGLQLAPMHAEMASYLAMGYLRQRRYDEALEKMTHALKCGPNNPNVLLNAIQSEDYLSFNEKQKALLLKVIETQQNSPQTKNAILLRQAKELIKQNQHAEALKVLGEMDDSINGLGPEKYFNIAQIQRSEGDPEKAFSTYKKANDMLAQSKNARKYNKYALIEKMQHQIDLLDEKFAESIKARIFHNDVKETYPNPVFLSGFPRSGTTLTGTILDQHPKLITTDEYGAMDQARIHFTQKFQKRLPDCLTDINAEEVKFLRDMYDVKQASIPSQNPDKILVDKIPLNTSNGIMIYAVFPNSKILYIHRHPLDAILSGYMQYFAMNSAMVLFNNIEDMAKLYVKMNEQWKSQKKYLPIDYHEFKYEDLVENFDEEVGKILDFIGVEWDDNVRNFNKEDASAAGPKTLTPSRTQVSQSLYKGARNRWKKYEKHLKPAIDILGDTIEELGYEL